MLFTALILGQLAQKLGQPSVLGELIGGIIIGPTILKSIAPFLYNDLFPTGTRLTSELNGFIQFGMIIFMFAAGLEVNLKFTWKKRKPVFFTSLFGIIVPFSLGVLMVFCVNLQGSKNISVNQWIYALFIGTALSISALPVILKTLMDLKMLKSEVGIVILSSATINDLFGWTIFACLISVIKSEQIIISTIVFSILKVVILILIIVIVSKIFGGFIKLKNKFFENTSSFIGVSIVFVLFISALAEKFGIHYFFAAFLLGTMLRKYYRINGSSSCFTINEIALGFFAPLYFVSIGLKVDFISKFDLTLVLLVLMIACIGKIAGSGIGAFVGGMDFKHSLCVGFGMNSRGAIEIIVASTALELKIIDPKIFVALVIMAIITSLISGPSIKRILKNDKNQIGVRNI